MATRKLVLTTHPGLVVSLVPRSRYYEVASFMVQHFFTSEVFCSTLKLADTETCKKALERHMLMELEHDLSFMAVDTTTNRVIGAQVNHEFTIDLMAARFEDIGKLSQVHSGWRTYATIMEQLYPKGIQEILGKDRAFANHVVTVLPNYAGKGIFKTLLNLSCERGVEGKYDVIFGWPSADPTRHLLRRLGFHPVSGVNLKDVIHEGKPAAPPTCTDRIEFSVKRLNPPKE